MSPTPDAVEPGQVWRDRDQRTKGAGEFTVLAVVGPFSWTGEATTATADAIDTAARKAGTTGDTYAVVRRESGRLTRIRVDRMFRGGARGYEYVGRSK